MRRLILAEGPISDKGETDYFSLIGLFGKSNGYGFHGNQNITKPRDPAAEMRASAPRFC
jgi:hypothetical protein